DLVEPLLVVCECPGGNVRQCRQNGAGQGGIVDDVRDLAVFLRVRDRIHERKATLRVRVVDLVRLAVEALDDVVGKVRVAAGTVSGGSAEDLHADRKTESSYRADSSDHVGTAAHVVLHSARTIAGLQIDAAGVEHQRLADRAKHD